MNDFNEYNFLCHHGILGMKWGIRRYQNKDGSLTSAGRARYGSDNSGDAKATRNNVDRLIEQNKDVDIYKLTESRTDAKQNIAKLEKGLSRISDLKSYNNREAMKDPKTRHEWRDAADLGLKVYEEDGEIEIDRNNKDDLNSWRSWFLYEDQTIGKPEIAAMVNRGYNKKEILDILDTAKNTGYYGDAQPENDFAAAVQFGAQEGYGLEYFVKRCLEEKQKH